QKGARELSASQAAEKLQSAGAGRALVFVWKRHGKIAGMQYTTMPQRPLWRFFPTRQDQGNDWIIWRWIDFYYDTRSPNADRYVGWHVNDAKPLGTPTFHPLERFRGTDLVKQGQTGEVGFHRPEKVWTTLQTALIKPDPIEFAAIEPPDVRVTIANPGRKPDQAVTLSVTITPRSARPD